MNQPDILVVEDEAIIAEDLRTTLQGLGYVVANTAASAEEALQSVAERRPDLALLDIRIKGEIDGISTADRLRELGIPVIFLTSYSDESTLQRARAAQPFGYLLKPFDERTLRAAIEMALHKHAMEERLADRERWLSTVLSSIGDGVIAADTRRRVSFMNLAAEHLSGWTQEDAVGRPIEEVFRLVDAATGSSRGLPLERAFAHGAASGLGDGIALVTKSGVAAEIGDCLAPILDDDGNSHGVVLVFRDVARERRAERALRESEERYRALFHNIPWPAWLAEAATSRFVEVNEAAMGLYGYSREEFLSMHIASLENARLGGGEPATDAAEFTVAVRHHRRKDGSVVEVDLACQAVHVGGRRALLFVARDITAQRRLEHQLMQNQKLEAVGRLAGGIAHDFNNLLTVVLNCSALALARPEVGSVARSHVEEIEKAALRAAELTKHLLAFTRQHPFETSVIDLNKVISRFQKMLSRVLGDNVELATFLTPSLGKIRADANRIEQVIMNLVVNARDALPAGGRVFIETSNVVLDERYASDHVEVTPGRYVMLAVSDTGIGMSAETKARIFEPFFTTKDAVAGTGLGLSTVFGIVRQTGGHVAVYSEIGRGSTFKIYFPTTGSEKAAAKPGPQPATAPRGSETILLVEDELRVRAVIRSVLQQWGYRVLDASNADEALAAFLENEKDVHMVLTDVVLSKGSGPQVVDGIRAIRPDVRALLMSGYAGKAIAHHGLVDPDVAFLQKPFTLDDLARKVREVLDRPAVRA